jgi:ribosomal-protein-alanine N-acetyltransferase
MTIMQHFRNNEVSVTRMTSDHLEAVAAIEVECFAEPWSAKSLEMLLGASGIAFVVCAQGTVVAYAGMMTVLDEGQITNVAVSRNFRRLGYGRLVVEELINYAKEHNFYNISLEVRESNSAAISLYENCGFEKCGIRKSFYRFPSEDAVIMSKTFNTP